MAVNTKTKKDILKIIQLPFPNDIDIVEQSVAIPFFGDIETAQVATISLNPSDKEFVDNNGNILPINKKKLIDRDILGRANNTPLTQSESEHVYASLQTYFSNRPYNKWFCWLEKYIGNIFNTSYYDGTMINLDIYPWATKIKKKDLDKSIWDNATKSYALLKNILMTNVPLFDYIYINGADTKQCLSSVCNININEIRVNDWTIYHYQLPNGIIIIGCNKYIQRAKLRKDQLLDLQTTIKHVLKTIYNKAL